MIVSRSGPHDATVPLLSRRENDVMERMERTETPGVGTRAPNFRLPAAQGSDIALEDYRGKRSVVLWFSKGLF